MTQGTEIRINPTIARLLRPLQEHEADGLEADLLRDGCIDPLIVWDGILVDGHHRYAICRKHGIPFGTKQMSFDSLGDACLWAWNHQDHRRNSNPYDRAERLLECEELVAAITKKTRAKMATHTDQGYQRADKAEHATKEIAALARVSHDTVHKVGFIRAHADEQTKERVRKGDLSIRQAYKAVRKDKEQEKKAQAKAAVPDDLPPAGERYMVHHGALSKAGNEVADGSVDWVITDPPYGKEYLHLYGELSDFAARVLRPGGSVICMAGQSYLPEIIEQLAKHLNYHWVLAYHTPGGQSAQLWERKVNTFWKPLLWFVKDRYEGDWIGDVCRSDVNDNDKRHHRWGQSESGMADIIERFTYPGQTICDPFCGGGTTGVVAVRMKRLFVGIDCDKEAVATALRRLAEAPSA